LPVLLLDCLPVRTKAVFVAPSLSCCALVGRFLLHGMGSAFRPGERTCVGLVYGLALAMMMEMLLFAGQICGLQFSFSLVNLLDPASNIRLPAGRSLQLMGTLWYRAGLDRILLASMVRSFHAGPWEDSFLPRPAQGVGRGRLRDIFCRC